MNDHDLLPIEGAECAQDLSLTARSYYMDAVCMQQSCGLSRFYGITQQRAPA